MWLPWRNRCPLDRLREFALVCRTTLRSELGDEAFELQYALGAESLSVAARVIRSAPDCDVLPF